MSGLLVPRVCRLLNRANPGGFGRKTLARIGRRWLPAGARVSRARVGNGFRMSLALDQYVDSAIYFHAFEYSTGCALARILRAGDTVIDVGANIGFFTLMACRRVGPEGRVVAFEPNSEIRRRLVANVALNDYRDRVTVRDCALSDANGSAQLYVPTLGPEGPAEASLRRQPGWAGDGLEQHAVVVRRLDALWRRDAPLRLMKLDVEGAELAALEGGAQVVQAQRPHVICEYNPATAASFGYDPSALLRFFFDRLGGYGLHLLASRGIVYDVAPSRAAALPPGVENLWFFPREAVAR